MSDHIPFEIQSEVMKRLPVKSLLRFRSVSKSWKSLIHSSNFIIHHSSQQQHLLVRYKIGPSFQFNFEYVSIVDDDDSFPHQQVAVTIPPLVVNADYRITDSSHGLLCLFDDYEPKAVIWNPSIRKVVAVTVPDIPHNEMYLATVGFGVCRETTDLKILKICSKIVMEVPRPWQVEVFTLSTGAWRRLPSSNLPSEMLYYWDQVVLDGSLYWLACGYEDDYILIVSFDLTSEEFGEVNLPDSLAKADRGLFMYKLRESLALVELSVGDGNLDYHVWMMEDGVSKSFKKLYTISGHSPDVSILRVEGLRKTGEPIIEVILQADSDSTSVLAAYDHYYKSFTKLGIHGRHFSVYPYMETLFLL